MKNDTTKSQLFKLDWVYTVETQSIFQKNHYVHVYLIMVWNKCEWWHVQDRETPCNVFLEYSQREWVTTFRKLQFSYIYMQTLVVCSLRSLHWFIFYTEFVEWSCCFIPCLRSLLYGLQTMFYPDCNNVHEKITCFWLAENKCILM